jgi:uncharacterized protein
MERQPATVMITRIVRPGHEAEYRRWLSHTLNAVERAPNHLRVVVFAPVAGESTVYRFVHHFADQASLRAWEKSELHRRLQTEADRFSESRREDATGLVACFTVPGMSAALPPARWKMTVLLYGIVNVLTALLIPLESRWIPPSWPFLLTNALLNAILILVMVYALLPLASRLLKRWLY